MAMVRFCRRFTPNFYILVALLAVLLLFFLLHNPMPRSPTKSVFVLIIDGMGAAYIEGFDTEPLIFDGTMLEKARLSSLERFFGKSAIVTQEFTETTSAHSLYYIAGDCGKRWQAIKKCVDDYGVTSICDFYRSKGYLCVMVSEAGDFREARNEFDVVLYDNGLFDFKVELNSNSEEAKTVAKFLEACAKKASRYALAEQDVNFFVRYAAFILDTDAELIKFMRKNFPEKKFFLFSNAKGIDLCGHKLSAKHYVSCIANLDHYLAQLTELRDSNTLFVVTADHGMAFDCLTCNGHHAGKPHSETPYAKRIPFILVSDDNISLMDGSAYDIMPTILELSGFKDACRMMRYCEGYALAKSS
jgi:hypothetical protein